MLYSDLINKVYKPIHTFLPFSKILFETDFLPFRPVLSDESRERGINLLNVGTLKISQLYTPDEGTLVIGIDVNEKGQILASLACEEPDTPECIIICSSVQNDIIKLDCQDIWYEGYGSALKWGASPSELIVINDFDPDEETIVTLDLKNKLVLNSWENDYGKYTNTANFTERQDIG